MEWLGFRSDIKNFFYHIRGSDGSEASAGVDGCRVKALVASDRAVPENLRPRLRRCTRKVCRSAYSRANGAIIVPHGII